MVITSIPSAYAKQKYYDLATVRVGFLDINNTKSLLIGLFRKMTHYVHHSQLQSCTEYTLVTGSVANMYASFHLFHVCGLNEWKWAEINNITIKMT